MVLLKKLFSFSKKPLTLEQYVKNRLAKGDTNEQIRKDLLDDLDKSGPIFGDFKKSLQPTFPNSKSRFRYTGKMAETGIATIFKFSVINSKKHPPCPDCLALDGQVKNIEEWEKVGFSVYGKCKCKNKCIYIFVSTEAIPIPLDEQDK